MTISNMFNYDGMLVDSLISIIMETLHVLIFVVFLLLSIAFTTLVERKVLGSTQRRRGPNAVGYLGLLQPFSDGLKLFIKEHLIPRDADQLVYFLAPVFTFFCSLKIWTSFPWDNNDFPAASWNGIIYLLIIMSLGAYGIIFAGWSSNSKYAFLGGLRSTAQMISYEVGLSFLFLGVCLLTQSVDLVDIVNIQSSVWFVFPLFPVWILFVVCALAETNRAPFDLPEAEAELVAGYNVEYSGIPFALFFLGEYSNIIAMSGLSSLLFWGGWLSPVEFLSWIPGSIWFALKTSLHVFLFIWVRATFPRYRYDQLMSLGWKTLFPVIAIFLFLLAILFLYVTGLVSWYEI